MPGLLIKLKAFERVVVGGVVLQNGQRRAQIRVEDDNAAVLRMSDALHPDDVTTPLTRAYFAAQSIVTCDANPDEGAVILAQLLKDATEGYAGFRLADGVREASEAARKNKYYNVLKALKPLLAEEAAILMRVNSAAAC